MGPFTHDGVWIERLNLASAARELYLANGKQVKNLADLIDLSDKLKVYGVPELWAVTRDDFLDPDKHLDNVKARLHEAKAAYKLVKQQLRALESERRQLKKQRVGELNETKQNILENQIDALTLDIEQATAQLAECKRSVLTRRCHLKVDIQSSTAKPLTAYPDVFTRLAKPIRSTLRVQARLNGNDKMSPEPCLGTSMNELLLSCAQRLKMRVVKRLYTLDGKRVRQLSDLKQAQEVYASAGEAFVDPVKQAAEVCNCLGRRTSMYD
jgi:hypothetical protein